MAFLDDVLKELDARIPGPLSFEDNGCTYILRKESRSWAVIKMDDAVLLATYNVRQARGRWYCSCPAGVRGRNCKHATWISVVANPKFNKG